jgi:thioredoxin-related protein
MKKLRVLVLFCFLSIICIGGLSAAEWGGFTEALENARESGKPIIVKFESDNCSACDKLTLHTLEDPDILPLLESFETAKVDVYDDKTPAQYQGREYTYRELSKHFKIKARPTSLFLRPDGTIIDAVRGYIPKQVYAEILNKILTDQARSE